MVRRTASRVPTGPALTRTGALGILGVGLSAIGCGETQKGTVPPAIDAPTMPPARDAGRDATADTHDAGLDSGYRLGWYDATGRSVADALAEAASDGHIFLPPCGVPPPYSK